MKQHQSRLKSFRCAFKGIFILIKDEANARIHLIAAVLAVVLGLFLKLNVNEWLWVVLAIFLVFIMELVNTAIENVADAVSKDYNKFLGKAKDLGAAATLLATIFALIIALFVFVPKILMFI
ncbi:diacylglycerol kinase family protein [Carboxylicivirga caseinilyticus]|uniref:diacylglycerol kinase family protein n=1 Tax=Carboxylicivirga caseinilyticus TaxID=3417572 RepID=UPI003D32E8DD|nr:diacylglycerol kinase family protein [Marinilabiliaceae bacterium A049]